MESSAADVTPKNTKSADVTCSAMVQQWALGWQRRYRQEAGEMNGEPSSSSAAFASRVPCIAKLPRA